MWRRHRHQPGRAYRTDVPPQNSYVRKTQSSQPSRMSRWSDRSVLLAHGILRARLPNFPGEVEVEICRPSRVAIAILDLSLSDTQTPLDRHRAALTSNRQLKSPRCRHGLRSDELFRTRAELGPGTQGFLTSSQ